MDAHARIIYNVPYIIPVGYFIAIYFYITGLHMGFYSTSVMATLLGKREWKPIGEIGAVGALIILVIAPFFLFFDLNQPLRFWHLFFYFNPFSAISWGTFFLTSYPLIGLIYAWHVYRGNSRPAKIWGLFGFPIAISVHGYTGFILALGKGRAFWSTSLNPILFLVSAMVSGLALIIIIANIRYYFFAKNADEEQKAADMRIINTLVTTMIIFLIIELFLMASDLAVLANSKTEEYMTFKLLTQGEWAPMFLGGELTLGGVIPLLLLSVRWIRLHPIGQCTVCVFILCGILAMRIVIVLGGQSVMLH